MTFRPTFNDDLVYAKTFLEIGTKPEFEIYELGHVSYVKWLMEENLVKLPVHLQFVFGPMVGWMTPSVKHLVLIHDEAKEVLGEENFTWSVAAGGRFQIPITSTAMAMGAQNVRIRTRGFCLCWQRGHSQGIRRSGQDDQKRGKGDEPGAGHLG